MFCVSNYAPNKVKTQPTEWKKIFLNYISDRRFVPRMYKEVL